MAKVFLLFFLWGSIFLNGEVVIEAPLNHFYTLKPTVDFVISSDQTQGFYLFGSNVIPIRSEIVIKDQRLNLGENRFSISILDPDLRLQPRMTRQLYVYRTLPIRDSVTRFQAFLITDLALHHQIQLLEEEKANLDTPILKRDLYAILVWFLNHQRPDFVSPHSIPWDYRDMRGYTQYLDFYRHQSKWLPRPIHENFYPNAFFTREEFINLMLLVVGGEDQISTSMHIKRSLVIPNIIADYIPKDWQEPLLFVSKRDVVDIFNAYFKLQFSDQLEKIVIHDSFQPLSFDSESLYALVKGRFNRGVQWVVPYVGSLSTWVRRMTDRIQSIKPRFSRQFFVKSSDDSSALLNSTVMNTKNIETEPSIQFEIVFVQPGDTIQKIARRYYGDSSQWEDLAKLNKLRVNYVTMNGQVVASVHIVPGQELKLSKNPLRISK